MSEELKGCPFCGASMGGDSDYMTHPKNDCILSEWEFDEPNVVAWNRRAPLPAEQPSNPVVLTSSQIECVIYALDAIVTEAKLPTPDAAHIENVANDVLPELRETWARIVGQQTKGGGNG